MLFEPAPVQSSRVGWPFWIPVLLTAIPFTVGFGVWATRNPHDPIAWWEWLFAIPIGLMPAMVLGLVVQTIWSCCVAARRREFGLLDGLFALLLLVLCVIPGWLYWRLEDRFEDAGLTFFWLVIICPLIRIYVRRRSKAHRETA